MGVDPDLWFPEPGDPGAAEQTRQAKQICQSCPVFTQCKAYAGQGQVIGIWAGDLIRYRHIHYVSPLGDANRNRNPQPCGTYPGAMRHRYHNEPVCEPCRLATSQYRRDRAARLKAAN